MKITKTQVERILETLPIGYYIKRNVEVVLSDSESSYCELINDKIVISYPMIEKAVKDLENDSNLEMYIRSLLYHETSHAFLTPLKMKVSDVINIFEDERIETIFNTYYKNTNFKKLLYDITKFEGEEPKSPMEEFYQTVRFRVGRKKFVDKVNDIIDTYKNLNRNSKGWLLTDYVSEINCLYENIKRLWDSKNEETRKKEYNEEKIIMTNGEGEYNFNKDEKINLNGVINSIITKISKEHINPQIINEFSVILSKSNKISKNNASAIPTYSGKFEPRSVIRDDYKYFIQQNRLGHLKNNSKIHMNLFIDVSGSFAPSEKIVNEMLYALRKIENQNPNFDFDLITCQIGQKIQDKNNRKIVTGGGNWLTKDIFSQFKKVQKKDAENVNIVLFDGNAFTDVSWDISESQEYKNFGAFNQSNCIIISSKSNTYAIITHCKKAQKIFTDNYSNELYNSLKQNLIKLLK